MLYLKNKDKVLTLLNKVDSATNKHSVLSGHCPNILHSLYIVYASFSVADAFQSKRRGTRSNPSFAH